MTGSRDKRPRALRGREIVVPGPASLPRTCISVHAVLVPAYKRSTEDSFDSLNVGLATGKPSSIQTRTAPTELNSTCDSRSAMDAALIPAASTSSSPSAERRVRRTWRAKRDIRDENDRVPWQMISGESENAGHL